MQINYLQDIMPSKWLTIKDNFINEEWQFLNDCTLRNIVCCMKLNNVEIICTGEDKNSKTEYSFDESGKLLEFDFHYKLNGVASNIITIFQYNCSGNIERINETISGSAINPSLRTAVFEYGSGLVSVKHEKTYFNRMFEYIYDQNQKLICIIKNKLNSEEQDTAAPETSYMQYGMLAYEYNAAGNLTCVKEFDAAEICVHRKNYIYDSSQKLKELAEYDNDILIIKKSYYYDAAGFLTAETSEYTNDSPLIIKYNYDETGLLMEAAISDSENIVKSTAFTYNDRGMVTKKVEFDKRVNGNVKIDYNYNFYN